MIQVYRTEINHCLTQDNDGILPDFMLEKDGVAMLPGFRLYCGQQIAALGKKMWKWWKRVEICITTVLNVLPTSAQQIKGRISFSLHNNRLQHQKKEKFFQVQHKEMGGQDTFLHIKFETSIKCDPRVLGITNSYTWVYI